MLSELYAVHFYPRVPVRDTMKHQFSLMKSFLILHIACVQVLAAESGMRPGTAWQRRADWSSHSHVTPPLASGRGRQASLGPEERHVYSFDAGTAGETTADPAHQGFGGFSRKKATSTDNVMRFGKFNSDTVSFNDN